MIEADGVAALKPQVPLTGSTNDIINGLMNDVNSYLEKNEPEHHT